MKALLLSALFVIGLQAASFGTVLVSNIANANDGGISTATDSAFFAQGFVGGAVNFDVSSVIVRYDAAPVGGISLTIFEDNGAGNPNTGGGNIPLITFNLSGSSGDEFTYTPDGVLTGQILAGTNYWVVVSGDSPGDTVNWRRTTNPSVTGLSSFVSPNPAQGNTLSGAPGFWLSAGSNNFLVEVNVVPEPEIAGLVIVLAGVGYHIRRKKALRVG